MRIKKLTGVITVSAYGTKIYKFINAVKDEGIACTNQNIHNDIFTGKIYAFNFKRVKQLAEIYGVTLSVTEKKGLALKVIKYRRRYGIIIGIVLAICLVFYYSNIALMLDVRGNSDVTEKQILQTLENMNIKKGKFIANMDLQTASQSLTYEIPQLSWCSIKQRGNRLIINVSETLPEVEILNENRVCNIVATTDAIITSVKVGAGQLKYIVGDGVHKGDVIVSGIVTGKFDDIRRVHALGTIRGIYEEEVNFTQNFNDRETVYEKEYTRKSFDFLGLKIPLDIKMSEKKADIEKTYSAYNIFGYELPIGIEYKHITPYKERELNYSAEEAEALLNEKIYNYEKNFFENTEIKNRIIEKKETENGISVTVSYVLEGEIGESKDVLI
ncbi:MAG: sporulation protein YqfD [Ruminococcus sp.]|jgi:similar to stage IV sporulation protein|nr:sporulation protein YqfD [Ruminococcus sp.]